MFSPFPTWISVRASRPFAPGDLLTIRIRLCLHTVRMSTPGAPLGPLDKDLPLPLYYQLKCAVRDAIDLGYWQAGEQLPNENKLAEDFGVSKITVRQALRQLADLGYVRREQGRGTFVSKPKLEHGPRSLPGFPEESRRPRVPAPSRVLEHSEAPPDARVAEALELCPGEPV